MKLKFKNYKLFKTKSFLKKENLVFIYHSVNLNKKYWVNIEQELAKSNLMCYKIHNTLFLNSIKTSIFFNILKNMSGPVLFSYIKPFDTNDSSFKTFKIINPKFSFLCLKVKKKVYSTYQLKNIKSIKFINNAISFNLILKIFIKNLFISNFLLINKKLISK